jgi:hypothetical protein
MITITPYVEVKARLLRDQLDSYRHMLPMMSDEEDAEILQGIIEKTEEELHRVEDARARRSD